MANGTMTYEDIYGAGSLDTLPATQGKTNPNDSEVTGVMSKDKTSIKNIKGGFLGQPITAWAGLFGLLVILKYVVENKA